MENQTPKWLKEGAFQTFNSQTKFQGKLFLGAILFIILFLIIFLVKGGAYYSELMNNKPGLAIFEILTFAFVSSFLLTRIHYLVEWKIGKNKKWQVLYLQSKIDEHQDYNLKFTSLVEEIEANAKKSVQSKIDEMTNNFLAMSRKKEEAEEWLQKI